MLQLRAADPRDMRGICLLLERNGLPTSDLASSRPEFVVAQEGAQLIGAGALARFGAAALLRSVVVAADRRGTGLGQRIVHELERRAHASGIEELVLLTQTAAPFFERHGYRVIERGAAASAVQASEEFRSLCPVSSVCMMKALAATSDTLALARLAPPR
ncbi:MAG: arsenic resistance N-acetyltransferase ArsN2 [Gammaproteobacteria bacterium]